MAKPFSLLVLGAATLSRWLCDLMVEKKDGELGGYKGMNMHRARFDGNILAEFLPPLRSGRGGEERIAKEKTRGPARRDKEGRWDKVIILCDGMPSIPRKQELAEFLAQKGYWVFYPRYRGAWESGGEFLARSPHLDILAVVDGLSDGLNREIRELAFGQRFRVRADRIFVIGGSFGGAAAILCSLDKRVNRVVANCPVVDWGILRKAEKAETTNANYAAYIRAAFGQGYRLSDRNWAKLYKGKFFNPVNHAGEINPAKIMMYHAKDDPSVPYESVVRFAELTGVKLNLLASGGHLSTQMIVRKYWQQISSFFASAS